MTAATVPVTFTYFLVLSCGDEIEQVEYVGVDISAIWGPGDGRWCRYCGVNSKVEYVRDPTFASRTWHTAITSS